MPSVDGQVAAWLKSPALNALLLPGGVAWTPAQAVDVDFLTPIDARADALTEAARTAAFFAGPNVKERIVIKGRRRDLLFKCVDVVSPQLNRELVSNGTFDSNIAGWTSLNPGNGTATWVSGRLHLENLIGGVHRVYGAIPTVVGATYHVEALSTRLSAAGTGVFVVGVSALAAGSALASVSTALGTLEPLSFDFTATTATSYIFAQISTTGGIGEADNMSVRRVSARVFVIGVAEQENGTTVLTVIRKLA